MVNDPTSVVDSLKRERGEALPMKGSSLNMPKSIDNPMNACKKAELAQMELLTIFLFI